MTQQKLREDYTGPQFSLIKLKGSEARIKRLKQCERPGLLQSRAGFLVPVFSNDQSDDPPSHNRLKCTIQKKTWRQKIKTKAKIGKRAIYIGKQVIRAVRVALMSLGMTFSFTPEVQITKSYCKNTMKIHWGYIGKYIVLTKGHIRIFEKKNEPERTEKD